MTKTPPLSGPQGSRNSVARSAPPPLSRHERLVERRAPLPPLPAGYQPQPPPVGDERQTHSGVLPSVPLGPPNSYRALPSEWYWEDLTLAAQMPKRNLSLGSRDNLRVLIAAAVLVVVLALLSMALPKAGDRDRFNVGLQASQGVQVARLQSEPVPAAPVTQQANALLQMSETEGSLGDQDSNAGSSSVEQDQETATAVSSVSSAPTTSNATESAVVATADAAPVVTTMAVQGAQVASAVKRTEPSMPLAAGTTITAGTALETSAASEATDCHRAYSPCLPVVATLDCSQIAASLKPVIILDISDPYGLDREGDGFGCEP